MTIVIPLLEYCRSCMSALAEPCCSLVEGRCAGRCDRDGHTYASVTAHFAELAANHETHIEDGENVSDCPKCGGE